MAKLKLSGIFFWRKKKKTEAEKADDIMQVYIKNLPQIRAMLNNQSVQMADGEIIGKMHDHYKDALATTEAHVQPWATFNEAPNDKQDEDKREKKKPVEVRSELEEVPTPFNTDAKDLDEKIELLSDKSRLSNQRFVKAQIEGMKKRLENRKKYKEFVDFYGSFPNTTDEKIDDLLKKYKLDMEESDLFVPAFPKEAIAVMKQYTEITEKVGGEAPVFYVIAEEDDFKEKRKKLDPILLVQSPFGFYWQILGAWDKEMMLLSEL